MGKVFDTGPLGTQFSRVYSVPCTHYGPNYRITVMWYNSASQLTIIYQQNTDDVLSDSLKNWKYIFLQQ